MKVLKEIYVIRFFSSEKYGCRGDLNHFMIMKKGYIKHYSILTDNTEFLYEEDYITGINWDQYRYGTIITADDFRKMYKVIKNVKKRINKLGRDNIISSKNNILPDDCLFKKDSILLVENVYDDEIKCDEIYKAARYEFQAPTSDVIGDYQFVTREVFDDALALIQEATEKINSWLKTQVEKCA